ncbi:zinc finger CCCH type domain protein (macronuclear) [Tetrahymena thermophila SB210]|uniref:Zinc finger CCCH type domain protein n=1 Tax=Tetrahymena thermophila (strain SB210) TaxID=312017 RepID=W7XCR6_TETTS|nr:zinc finger CCCH type domain protein [Tetrahymena thermophila SB210]EWS71586.1 zinc finger CCCH type domain protein [Tetrahymena thermophila SB210]|eukprot:XP_012655882.1 zinc finger CCCH type domain protein [Tetrahymena thermophila SB210]
MGDQMNNYEINYNQPVHPLPHMYQMYPPNMNPLYQPHNNIAPHHFSSNPNIQFSPPQTHQQHLPNTSKGMMIYNQQPSGSAQNSNQQNITSVGSKGHIDGMAYKNQHESQPNAKQNVRIPQGNGSYTHLNHTNHSNPPFNPNNSSHLIMNNSPPPLTQNMKGRNINTRSINTNGLIQDQYSNEENQEGNPNNNSNSNNNTLLAGNSQVINTKPLQEHLELSNFKVEPCQNTNAHNHKQCKYYHTQRDKRRQGVNYTSDQCQHQLGNCPDGDYCLKAHNKVEELYCPDKYKTKFCTHYPNMCHNCEYGIYCSFAHDESDIKIDLIENYEFDEDFYVFYYKTVWCPFNFIKHDKAQCVYSHNWQDYRRRPQDYNYEPVSCPNWKPASYITKYEEGCPNKFDCNKCHGWKESEYHPRNYRTKQCTQTTNNEKCNKGPQCPYYHNAQEKRNIPQNIQEGLFKYRPRNRNIRGTYKTQQGQTPNDSQPFASARLNQLNSTQSLPDHHSNLKIFGTASKKQSTCMSPIIQCDQQQASDQDNTNGIPPVAIKKPIRLNTTSQLESINKKNSIQNTHEDMIYCDQNQFDDEQTESIHGIMSENNRWANINGNTHPPTQQQFFQIFSQKSYENFSTNLEYNNNNQHYQPNHTNFHNNPNMIHNNSNNGLANPELNEVNQQLGHFSLQNYDNSQSDHI